MEQLVNIPKVFEFSEEERDRLAFSDETKIRLVSGSGGVTLKRVEPGTFGWFSDPTYPTVDDVYVKTWLATPQSVTRWVAFDFWGDVPGGTEVGFRLSADGTSQKYWDGASWRNAVNAHGAGTSYVPGEWNTVQEVYDHIGSFPTTAKSIQVICRLLSEDGLTTPVVRGVGVLYEASIDQDYDLNQNSLGEYLGSVRPRKDWVLRLLEDSEYVDLKPDTEYNVGGFNVVEVVEVFDETSDPDHDTNLYASYSTVTKRLAFTAEVPAGHEVLVRFSYRPVVAFMTNQDYSLMKIPGIAVEGMDELSRVKMPSGVAFRNRTAGTALVSRAPYRCSLRYTLRVIADRGRDLASMRTELRKKLTREPLLHLLGTDEQVSMKVQKGLADYGQPNLSDLEFKRFVVDILDVCYWDVGERTASLVTSGLKASGDMSFLSGSSVRPT